mgnify:CR=1 FL=1
MLELKDFEAAYNKVQEVVLPTKLIKSDYVRDIAEHPEKTYTTRLRNKGKIYDLRQWQDRMQQVS